MKERQKRFVIRKYVMAVSAAQALRKEKDVRADDCWIDEKWLDNNPDTSGSVMGFHT